jgi:hypothetical protein
MVKPKDRQFDFQTVVAPELTASEPLIPSRDAGRPLHIKVITVTTNPNRNPQNVPVRPRQRIRVGVITREPMDLEEPTRLGNIFHTTEPPHSHQHFDRCDERLVVLTEEQLNILNDFTTAFLKMLYANRNIEEMQQKSDRLSGLDKYSARYLIVPLGAPQTLPDQLEDEDAVEETLVQFGDDLPPKDASVEVVRAWIWARLDWDAILGLQHGNRFASTSDR